MPSQTFNTDKVLKFIYITLGIGAVAYILFIFQNLALLFVFSIILSYILDPIVNFLQRRRWPRLLAITTTLILLAAILVLFFTIVIPILTLQIQLLAKSLTIENLRPAIETLENDLRGRFDLLPPDFLYDGLKKVGAGLVEMDEIPNTISNVISIFTDIFSALIVIPFATFFFLKDGTRMRRHVLELIPNKYFETVLTIIYKIEQRLGTYFKSILAQSTIVGTLSWLFLSFVGLDNALTLGLAIGLANSIPYFGPLLGYFLCSAVAVIETGDLTLVGNSLLAILAIQLIDNIILQPALFSKSADMHPVSILFLILIGAEAAGLIGMLFAIPVATIVKITLTEIKWSVDNYRIFNSDEIDTQTQSYS